jgi:hypothetical protein
MVWRVPPEDTVTRESLLKAREEDGKGCWYCRNETPPPPWPEILPPKCGWCKTNAKRTATKR